MGLQRFVIGAALGAILAGLIPATAGADGQADPRATGIAAHGANGPKSALPEHGRGLDPWDLRDRFETGASDRRHDERERLHVAIERLRRLVQVSVQKPACHPRGKPPHGPVGSDGYAPVGFWPGSGIGSEAERWDDHDRDHGDHGDHGHMPPFCPSPH